VNILSLRIDLIGANEGREIDGMHFSSCAIVQIDVDGQSLLDREDFRGSCIYFPELENSALASGRFLIFTCACGIADDAGWTQVEVVHSPGIVSWTFEREVTFHFVFALPQYKAQIESCRATLGLVPDDVVLEPQCVVFPE
jgi:hypothetical protein